MFNSKKDITRPDIPGPNPFPNEPKTKLLKGSCDTHAHLFGPSQKYSYVTNRAYTPPEASEESYRHMLNTMGFTRAVLVQPSVYGIDNRFLLETLKRKNIDQEPDDIQWRGVAVVSDSISDKELYFMNECGVKGIRVNLLYPGGIDFETIQRLSDRIEKLNWHIQFLIDVSKFADLHDRLIKLPVDIVIDHMGHLSTKNSIYNEGFQALLSLLKNNKAWVKLTGPNRMTQLQKAPYKDVDKFFNVLVKEAAHRCVFGTDWPHVALPNKMPNDAELVNEFLRLIPNHEIRKQILVNNPIELYNF